MSIGTKRFNWVQRPSSWQYAQAWKSHRSSMVQSFLNDSASAASAFLSAQSNLSVGLATLAAQASIQRAQSEIRATAQQFTDTKNLVNLLA